MIESAILVQLDSAIKWGGARATDNADGSLTSVDTSSPLDITAYSKRDRELAYRDCINATAILRVAYEIDNVWNAGVTKPVIEGLTEASLPFNPADTGLTTSKIRYVRNASVVADALTTDMDLATRDAIVYEALARACAVLKNTPVTPNDPTGSTIGSSSTWSLGNSINGDYGVNAALPMARDTFRNPDRVLAGRDNVLAGYVARIAVMLANPFAYASRLYVTAQNVDVHEPEIYSYTEIPYRVNTYYQKGYEVIYNGTWYSATSNGVSSVPGTSSDWTAIQSPTKRVFLCEPALSGDRNRIVYDSISGTLQWFRQLSNSMEVPQIAALAIPGIFNSQVVSTLTEMPKFSDAYFWKLKADQIQPAKWIGTVLDKSQTMFNLQDIAGVQVDTVGMPAFGSTSWQVNASIQPGVRYNLAVSFKPEQSISIYGAQNYGIYGEGISDGTGLGGATLTGVYAPTPSTKGQPVTYKINLPPSSWLMTIEYTCASGASTEFGVIVTDNGKVIKDDAVPLTFVDSTTGLPLPNGTLLTSNSMVVASNGGEHDISIQWTYGSGSLNIRKITFYTSGISKGYYDMKCSMLDSNGNKLSDDATSCTYGIIGEEGIFNFDFKATASATNPTMVLTWTDGGAAASSVFQYQLPIRLNKMAFQRVSYSYGSPDWNQFPGWSNECMNRSIRYIQDAFSVASRVGAIPTVSAGTTWTEQDTDAWMHAIECYVPRLIKLENPVQITEGRQYSVTSGSIAYNGETYYAGDAFYGVTGVYTYSGTGSITQLGVCLKALPSDIGRPAILPYGISNSNGSVTVAYDSVSQYPIVSALEPWMLSIGAYVLDYNDVAFAFDPPNAYDGAVIVLNALPATFSESISLSATVQYINCVSTNFYLLQGTDPQGPKSLIGTGTYSNGLWSFTYNAPIVTSSSYDTFMASAFDEWGNEYYSNTQSSLQVPPNLRVKPVGSSVYITDNGLQSGFATEGQMLKVDVSAFGPGCTLVVESTNNNTGVTSSYQRIALGDTSLNTTVYTIAIEGSVTYTFYLVDSSTGYAVTPTYGYVIVATIDATLDINYVDSGASPDFFDKIVLHVHGPTTMTAVEYFASTDPSSGWTSLGNGSLSPSWFFNNSDVPGNDSLMTFEPDLVATTTQWWFYAVITDTAGHKFGVGWSTLAGGQWSTDFSWSGYQQFTMLTAYQVVAVMNVDPIYTSSGAGTTLYVDYSSYAPTSGFVTVTGLPPSQYNLSQYPTNGTISFDAQPSVSLTFNLYTYDSKLLWTQTVNWTAPSPSIAFTADSSWSTANNLKVITNAGQYATTRMYLCDSSGGSRQLLDLVIDGGIGVLPPTWNSSDNAWELTYSKAIPANDTPIYFVASVTNQYGLYIESPVQTTTQVGYDAVISLAVPPSFTGGSVVLTPSASDTYTAISSIDFYATDATGTYSPTGSGSPVLLGTTYGESLPLTIAPNVSYGASLYYIARAVTPAGPVLSNVAFMENLTSTGLYNTGVDNNMAILADGSTDNHYVGTAYASWTDVYGSWTEFASDVSKAVVLTNGSSSVTKTFTLTSTQAAQLNSSVSSIKWQARGFAYEQVQLTLNSTVLGTANAWTPTTSAVPAIFVAGTNTITVAGTSYGQCEALQFEFSVTPYSAPQIYGVSCPSTFTLTQTISATVLPSNWNTISYCHLLLTDSSGNTLSDLGAMTQSGNTFTGTYTASSHNYVTPTYFKIQAQDTAGMSAASSVYSSQELYAVPATYSKSSNAQYWSYYNDYYATWYTNAGYVTSAFGEYPSIYGFPSDCVYIHNSQANAYKYSFYVPSAGTYKISFGGITVANNKGAATAVLDGNNIFSSNQGGGYWGVLYSNYISANLSAGWHTIQFNNGAKSTWYIRNTGSYIALYIRQ